MKNLDEALDHDSWDRCGEIPEKILALEMLTPTLLLFVDCCRKKGCNLCAEKQLLQGLEIVQRILHDKNSAAVIREKARAILKKFVDELSFHYQETEQIYEFHRLKLSYAKTYFHLYSIDGDQS